MEEDTNKKKQREVRKKISCENCGSHYVYTLKDMTIICRRCSHRTIKKK